MGNNSSFRINKYFRVSLVIGLIDFLTFYLVGKAFNYMEMFNILINKWEYIALFISTITLVIYFFDVLLFYNRNRKFKFLLIFKEPFNNWKNYINNINVKKEHINLDFYSDIYFKVKNSNKIMGIGEDEILIRDIAVHLITTNVIILFGFFWIEKIKLRICFYCLSIIVITHLLLNMAYRNYLKYYITEIYKEYLNTNKK